MVAFIDRIRRPPAPGSEMPFLDHLEELRWRLLWSILAIIVCSGFGIWLVIRFDVLGLLMAPIRPLLDTGKLTYLSPADPFFLTLRLGLTVGFLLASPVLMYQLWSFVAPALLPSEKRAIVPSLYLGLVLFAGGVAMAYYLALPMTLQFFMTFQVESLEAQIVAGEYFSLVIKMLLAFGAIFEVPVVVLVLSAMGLVTSAFLREKRRYAIAGMTIVASLLTSGDVVMLTMMMMLPMVLLYELSIGLAVLMERRRAREVEVEGAQA